MARIGVSIVTEVMFSHDHSLVRWHILTDRITPSPSIQTGSFTEETADNVSTDPNVDRARDRGEDSPKESTS